MNCPSCGKDMLKVKDTRQNELMVMRRRECQNCGYAFHTKEIAVKYEGEFKVCWREADRNKITYY